ncbi:hypothetical protein BC349_05815 [Flavihumibacter stibioxidans]|uniref:Uncharacterized protein n=2 Tax=Flavihumibacter stibioxidans TaxID=1834163 RepID=A0ABR7M678_9BACT|nr:hypothetical protein [Flavihumibacter stibioxidans]
MLLASCDQSLPRTDLSASGQYFPGLRGTAPVSGGQLNPAHGMPGHRCDIAVGAPLANAGVAPLQSGSSLQSGPSLQSGSSLSSTGMNNLPAVSAPNLASLVNKPLNPAGQSLPVMQQPTTPVPVSAVSQGLNPKHGEPGHRCDIAVGAPLNSAASSTNTTTTANPVAIPANNSITLNQNNSAGIKTSAGLNPKHGEPGHRCDIAVGAPLNSKPVGSNPPVKPALTPATANPGSSSNLTTSPAPLALISDTVVANTNFQPNTTSSTTGLNPKHGEPGHRCDIAVGAPLNSKTNQ